MAQQKGFKRAIKVAIRAKNKKIKVRETAIRKVERAEEVAAAPAVAAKK
jgi:hypothetical protein